MKLLKTAFLAACCLASAEADERIVASSSSNFSIVTGAGQKNEVDSFTLGAAAWGFALDAEANQIYVSFPVKGSIEVIGTSGQVLPFDTFYEESGAVFHGLALAGSDLYALESSSDRILRFDTSDGSFVSLASGVFQRPNDILVDLERSHIWVTDSGLDQVICLDLQGNTLASVKLNGAWGIAKNPVDGRIYAGSFDDGQLFELRFIEVEGGGLELVADLLSGSFPNLRGLSFNRRGDLLYLQNFGQLNTLVDLSDPPVVGGNFWEFGPNGHAFVVFQEGDLDGDFLGDNWERANAKNLAVLSGSSNPDADGFSALAEYAFAGSAVASESSLTLETLWQPDGTSVVRIPSTNDPGILTLFEVSSDLDSWMEIQAVFEESSVSGYSDAIISVSENEQFGTNGEKLFFRATARANR